jgi:hypothetical protein
MTTGHQSAVAEYLQQLLQDNALTLGLAAVYYGDQDKIPVNPAACIEPDNVDRTLNGASRVAQIVFNNYILVYHSAITDVQTNRKAADELADAIVDLVHAHSQLNGLVIDSVCVNVESGYSAKQNTVMRSSRISVQARSREILPSSAL